MLDIGLRHWAWCFMVLGLIHAPIAANELPQTTALVRQYAPYLTKAHEQIMQGARRGEFVQLRGYSLIDYEFYKTLSPKALAAIKKPLVFFYGVLHGAPLYKEGGGVSMGSYPISAAQEKNAPLVHLQFQGRYFTDLVQIGSGHEFYALCNTRPLRNCLLLGVGERW